MPKKITYRFHDPNPPEVAAEYLFKLFLKVNEKKVANAIAAAFEENDKQKKNPTKSHSDQER